MENNNITMTNGNEKKHILDTTTTNEKLLYNSLIPYEHIKFISEHPDEFITSSNDGDGTHIATMTLQALCKLMMSTDINNIKEENEMKDDDIIGLSVYQFTRSYHVFPDDLDFSLSEEMYIGYEPNELVLVKTHDDNGQVIYYCDAVDVILTTEQLMNSTITDSDDGLTRLYIKPEKNN